MTQATDGLLPFPQVQKSLPCLCLCWKEETSSVFVFNFIAGRNNKFNKASGFLTMNLNQGQGSEHGVIGDCV